MQLAAGADNARIAAVPAADAVAVLCVRDATSRCQKKIAGGLGPATAASVDYAALTSPSGTGLVKIAHITGLFFAVGTPHKLGRFMQNHAQ